MAVGPSASSSSSSVTTSATTSSPSSLPSASSSSGHGGSPFSANGTAALILAFLAIGLFVGGMVAMIGLRRRALERAQRWIRSETPSPVWAQDFPEPESPSGRGRSRKKKKKDVGTPPKLYDVYAPTKGIGAASWRTILVSPLVSATISQCLRAVRTLRSGSLYPQGQHLRECRIRLHQRNSRTSLRVLTIDGTSTLWGSSIGLQLRAPLYLLSHHFGRTHRSK